MSKRTSQALFIASMLVLLSNLGVAAQAKTSGSVKWQPVIGYEKEFVIFMPAGFSTVVDDKLTNFGRSRAEIVSVKRSVKVTRLINGTVLTMFYYEAEGNRLFEFLSATNKLSATGEATAGKFRVKRFGGMVRARHVKTHYFIDKRRLYVATAYSREAKDPIADAYFASVRLADGGSYIAPNAEGDAASTALPLIREVAPERSPDPAVFGESEVDRDAIVLYQPEFRSVAEPGFMPQFGRVTAHAILSADGTVKEVKTSGNAPFDLQKAFAETIERIVFVPLRRMGNSYP